MTKHVTSEDFQAEVVNSELPVLVDFSASWCGPCRAIAPVIDKLADEFDGKYKVVKLDIDESPSLAQEYQVRGVPTFIFMENGEEISRHVGAGMTEVQFREKLLDTFSS